MHEDHVIKSLFALAHAVRLRVFRALVVAGAEGLTPSVLTEQLGVPSSALSFHLKEMVNAGLVTQERVGRNLLYRAHFEQMASVVGYLTQNCCAGNDCELNVSPCCPTAHSNGTPSAPA